MVRSEIPTRLQCRNKYLNKPARAMPLGSGTLKRLTLRHASKTAECLGQYSRVDHGVCPWRQKMRDPPSRSDEAMTRCP